MNATTQLTSTEIKRKLADAECDLASAQGRLQDALKAAALGDHGGDDVASIRTQMERLTDQVDGLRMLAVDTEIVELDAEIERRETAHELDAKRVASLYDAFNRGTPVPEGVGSSFGAALRKNRARDRDAFAEYERANIAHLEEAKTIASLVKHRDELARRRTD